MSEDADRSPVDHRRRSRSPHRIPRPDRRRADEDPRGGVPEPGAGRGPAPGLPAHRAGHRPHGVGQEGRPDRRQGHPLLRDRHHRHPADRGGPGQVHGHRQGRPRQGGRRQGPGRHEPGHRLPRTGPARRTEEHLRRVRRGQPARRDRLRPPRGRRHGRDRGEVRTLRLRTGVRRRGDVQGRRLRHPHRAAGCARLHLLRRRPLRLRQPAQPDGLHRRRLRGPGHRHRRALPAHRRDLPHPLRRPAQVDRRAGRDRLRHPQFRIGAGSADGQARERSASAGRRPRSSSPSATPSTPTAPSSTRPPPWSSSPTPTAPTPRCPPCSSWSACW